MKRSMFFLDQEDIPTHWYNIQADLPEPLPPVLHPATGKPVGPEDLAPLFPMELIKQEVSTERWIEIPEKGPGYPCEDILQIRRDKSGWKP